MTRDRSIDLFDEAQPNARHDTTHVHAYLSFVPGGYAMFVTRYRDLDAAPGVRGYPLGATVAQGVEAAGRYNAKRLAALAADPSTLALARNLSQEF